MASASQSSSWSWDFHITIPRTSFGVEETGGDGGKKSRKKEYAIYHIRVETVDYADVPSEHRIQMDVPKRFNDFRNFHADWTKLYAALGQQVPLPTSVTLFKNDQHVVSRRRFQLQAYLQKLGTVKAVQPLLAQFLGIKFKDLNWREQRKDPSARRFAEAVDQEETGGNTTLTGGDPHLTLESVLRSVEESRPQEKVGPKGLVKYDMSVKDAWHSESRPMKGNTLDASEAAYQAKMDFINKHRGILDSLLPGRTYTLGMSSSSLADQEERERGKIKIGLWLTRKEGLPEPPFDHDLHVTVYECIDLPKSSSGIGFADPYVKMYVLPDPSKQSKQKTVVRNNTLNPKYNQTFVYEVSRERLKSRRLEISVWDRDLMSAQHFMGQVIIPLADGDLVGENREKTTWLDLKSVLEGTHAWGQIRRKAAGSAAAVLDKESLAKMDASGDYFEYEAIDISKPLGMNLPAGENATGATVGHIDAKGGVAAWNAKHTGVQSPLALRTGDILCAVRERGKSGWTDVRSMAYPKLIETIRSSRGKTISLQLRRYGDMETLGVRVLKTGSSSSSPMIGGGGGGGSSSASSSASREETPPIHVIHTKEPGEGAPAKPSRPARRKPEPGKGAAVDKGGLSIFNRFNRKSSSEPSASAVETSANGDSWLTTRSNSPVSPPPRRSRNSSQRSGEGGGGDEHQVEGGEGGGGYRAPPPRRRRAAPEAPARSAPAVPQRTSSASGEAKEDTDDHLEMPATAADVDENGGYWDAEGYYWDAAGYCWDPSGAYCWDAEGNCYDADGNYVEDPQSLQEAPAQEEGAGEEEKPSSPPPRRSRHQSEGSAASSSSESRSSPPPPVPKRKTPPSLPSRKINSREKVQNGNSSSSGVGRGSSLKARMAMFEANGGGIGGGRRPPPRR